MLTNTCEEETALKRALKEYVAHIYSTYANKNEGFFVGFDDCFGMSHLGPLNSL